MDILTLFGCTLDIIKILARKFGFPRAMVIIAGSIARTNKVYKNSSWGMRNDPEAKYIKSIALFPAIYFQLREKFDEPDVMEVINEIVIKVSWTVDMQTIKKHNLMNIENPFERWQKYRSVLAAEGFGLFNEMQDVEVNENRMHYIVRRCIFYDFMSQIGKPEIAGFICDYDKLCHAKLFPEFEFSRNGSWENTLGHGHDCCHYLWERKNPLPLHETEP